MDNLTFLDKIKNKITRKNVWLYFIQKKEN